MYEGCFLQTRLSKTLNVSIDQRLAQAFVLKHVAEPLKCSFELSKVYEKTKSLAKSLKNSAACSCYNTAHAVPIITVFTFSSSANKTGWLQSEHSFVPKCRRGQVENFSENPSSSFNYYKRMT